MWNSRDNEMKSLLHIAVVACLLGTCLAEAAAKPDPAPKAFPEALASAFAKAFPQGGAVEDLLSGLSTLLQNLLAGLLGGHVSSMMSSGSEEDGCDDCVIGCGGGYSTSCGECDSCSCECCITTCFEPVRQIIPVTLAQYYGLY